MYLNIDLLKEFKDNSNFCNEGSFKRKTYSDKGYKIIEHTYDLLKQNSQFYNEDIVSNLRKAINLRTDDINNNIGFQSIKSFDKNTTKQWDKLEKLGIVKSFLLNKLLKIRNGIEYHGDEAPSLEECHEWIDVVWYFYKSTDNFCKFLPDNYSLEYKIDNDKYYMILEFDFKDHDKIKFFGRLPKGFISENKDISEAILIYDYSSEHKKRITDNFDIVIESGVLKTADIKNYVEIISLLMRTWEG